MSSSQLSKEIISAIDLMRKDLDVAKELLTAHVSDLTQEELTRARRSSLVPLLETTARRRA